MLSSKSVCYKVAKGLVLLILMSDCYTVAYPYFVVVFYSSSPSFFDLFDFDLKSYLNACFALNYSYFLNFSSSIDSLKSIKTAYYVAFFNWGFSPKLS